MSVRMTDYSDSSYADARQIDAICLAFEDAWLRGETPCLESYLSEHRGHAAFAGALVVALLEVEFVYRRRRGETPLADDYVARLPEFDEEVRWLFRAEECAGAELPELAAGTQLGRYRLQRELGRGAFGTVFLAEDMELRRPVAIKIAGDGRRASREQTARLLEEARAAAGLRHPGLVALYDVQPFGPHSLFAVQEFVDGVTLRAALEQPSDYRSVARLFAQISDAIAYAHAQGFVHRDLDPDNILIDGDGRPRITDFGLALQVDEQERLAGERAGSWAYMSPEQVRGEAHRLDGRADIWAIGVMLYEALTRRRPFRGSDVDNLCDDILHRAPRPPRQFVRGIPPQLERICLRCLAKTPEERFATAGDLANALREAAGDGTRLAGRRAMLVGAPLGLLAAMLAWRYSRPRANPAAIDRQESLELHVWKHRGWRPLSHLGALPLRTGDQLRLTIRCHPARHAYIVWIDARGQAAPVYPWLGGDWTQIPRATRPVSELQLPSSAPDAVWTMEAPQRGCELLMLLTRDEPWLEAPRGLELFDPLPLTVDLPPDVAVRMDYEQLVPLGTGERSIDVGAVGRLEDPLVRLQAALRERLSGVFPSAQFLLFPVAS